MCALYFLIGTLVTNFRGKLKEINQKKRCGMKVKLE